MMFTEYVAGLILQRYNQNVSLLNTIGITTEYIFSGLTNSDTNVSYTYYIIVKKAPTVIKLASVTEITNLIKLGAYNYTVLLNILHYSDNFISLSTILKTDDMLELAYINYDIFLMLLYHSKEALQLHQTNILSLYDLIGLGRHYLQPVLEILCYPDKLQFLLHNNIITFDNLLKLAISDTIILNKREIPLNNNGFHIFQIILQNPESIKKLLCTKMPNGKYIQIIDIIIWGTKNTYFLSDILFFAEEVIIFLENQVASIQDLRYLHAANIQAFKDIMLDINLVITLHTNNIVQFETLRILSTRNYGIFSLILENAENLISVKNNRTLDIFKITELYNTHEKAYLSQILSSRNPSVLEAIYKPLIKAPAQHRSNVRNLDTTIYSTGYRADIKDSQDSICLVH